MTQKALTSAHHGHKVVHHTHATVSSDCLGEAYADQHMEIPRRSELRRLRTTVTDTTVSDELATDRASHAESSPDVDHWSSAIRNYSIVGPEREEAMNKGLSGAVWYTTPLPRDEVRLLMERRDGPAARNTLLWLVFLVTSGYLAHRTFGTWWMIPTFFVYGTLYGSTSDARWHECGHRTAFRTMWMNDILYHVASFMSLREAVSWRWSHVRHHSDTVIVGRDTEIAFERPMQARVVIKECFGLSSGASEIKKVLRNVAGKLTAEELDYIPEAEQPKAIRTGRIYCILWIATLAAAIAVRSVEPLLFVVGPSFYGRWLMVAYGITQHAGLAEDTLDHRLNSRSVRMNRVHRFLYMNMNYHAEHHMFPSVPYHSLPALNVAVQNDFPPMLPGFRATYRQIWVTYRCQQSDPTAFTDRRSELPNATARPPSDEVVRPTLLSGPVAGGWLDVGPSASLDKNNVIRVDVDGRTFAVYRLADGEVFATDGLCTHASVHLCDGLVIDGQIECPKHNARFDIATGRALRRPATTDLAIHSARERDGRLELSWAEMPEFAEHPISTKPSKSTKGTK